MATNLDSVEVRINSEDNRYEVHLDGHMAWIDYRLRDNRLTLLHTDVPPEFEGKGIASKMVRFALEDARDKGYEVVSRCPFVTKYIERHPEYQSLVKK